MEIVPLRNFLPLSTISVARFNGFEFQCNDFKENDIPLFLCKDLLSSTARSLKNRGALKTHGKYRCWASEVQIMSNHKGPCEEAMVPSSMLAA